jgi:CDP-glycerol glycerophosphotransferase (TagB/SpsB family)
MPDMPPRPRLRSAGRTAFGRLPGGARSRILKAVGERTGIAGAEVGLVSAVVVVEPGDRVEECLASLRGQSHGLLEAVVCPVGSAVAELPDDPRFRAGPPATTWYAAANLGIGAAVGDYVVLIRGCDQLLPHAVEAMAGSLAGTGSDLATGVLEQAGEPEHWLQRAQADSHEVSLSAQPVRAEQAADLTLANKAFTRDFARRLRLVETDDWLCSPTLAHLLPAATLDVLERPVARWAPDRGHRAYGARPSPLPLLEGALLRRDLVAAAVAGSVLADGWLRHWYDVQLPRFVADAERADEATWLRLVELVHAPRAVELRAASRSLLWLAGQGRRDDVEALAAELASLGDDVPTELPEDGQPLARWRSVDLPAEVRRLADSETRLRLRLVRAPSLPEGRAVDLFVRIEGVDLAQHPLHVTADAGGDALDVDRGTDLTANRWAAARFQSAAEGAVSVTVPERASRLTVAARVGAVERSGTVSLPAPPTPVAVPGPLVQAVTLDGDQLVVHLDRPADGLRLRGPGTDLAGEPRRDGTVAFDLRRDLYGRPTLLPTAVYRLHRADGLGVASAWSESLPVEVLGNHHRLRVLPGGGGPGDLHLGPPRADDELGAYGQEQLRASYAADPRPTDPGLWYFESFAGRSATDTPRAVFEEVRRRSPERRVVWGVLDHGHWIPEGATPVVIGTRAWYDVLGTARVLVVNTELEEWYRRRADQFVVQCFHGYPSKAMGESQWQARELPPSRVAVMRRRSVDTWDLISTPTPTMTAVYREQYGYAGPAAEQGYPRNDALRGGPAAEETRLETRRRLGIAPDQTAVLYAPTWRDHLASRPRAAAMTEHLDVDAAAASLGESHVILLRGHRFHAPGRSRRGIVDVTDHPEINDLVLASDVAVLDYSSLRFDYALTRRPMVFLVPDLEDYTGGVRGFLFPFTDTAPGPLVSTTDEVVAQVRDVPALSATWAERVRAFDNRFNPWQDGQASSRFVDVLERELAKRPSA